MLDRRQALLFVTVAALWGAPYALIKVAVDDLPPTTLALLRLAIGAFVLLPIAIRSGAFADLRGRWRWVVFLGLIELAAPFTLIGAGEQHIPSSLTGILVASVPLMLSVATIRDLDERGGPLRLLGVLVGLAGVIVLLGFDVPTSGDAVLGAGMVLLACAGYAAGGLALRYRFAGTRVEGVMCAAMAVGALALLAPGALAADEAAYTSDAALATVVLGIGPTGMAFYLFAVLNAEIGPARSSIIAYIAPAFAVMLGVLFLGEQLTAAMVAGMGLILIGSRLATGR